MLPVILTKNVQIKLLYFVSGVLPLAKWCEALEAATHLGLPWRMLRERLSPPELDKPPTEVDYVKTLVLLDTDAIVSKIMFNIYTNIIFILKDKQSTSVIFFST